MAGTLTVELVSPESLVFSGEANMVITRTLGGGEIAFQAGHAPFVGALVENHARIFLTDGSIQDVAVHRGFVEVSDDRVSILSDSAELADDIDVERARVALERHEKTLREEQMEEKIADAVAGRARARARLTATGNSFIA